MFITKKTATKPERVLADLFIRRHVPFEFRKMIEGREVDFLIKGKVAVEVDGVHHRFKQERDKHKNEMLARLGYIPLHFKAKELRTNAQRTFKEILKLVDANT